MMPTTMYHAWIWETDCVTYVFSPFRLQVCGAVQVLSSSIIVLQLIPDIFLSDDDDAADPVDQHLGEISVMFDLVDQVQQDDIELHSDSTVEQEDEVHSSDGEKDQEESDHSPSPAVQAEDVNRSSPPIQITSSVIHEKAKKAGSHYIQYVLARI
jgi:hypothetical protein